jgi:hypothetical protein
MKIILINSTKQSLITFFILIVGLSQTVQAKETIYLSEIPDPQNKIAVVTNRSVLNLNNDSIIFGSSLDLEGHASYLTASYTESEWHYARNNSLKGLLNQDFKHENWVIFVHGDGKDLKSAIKRAKEIEELHQVNVLAYAWPSRNPDLGAINNFKNSYANVEKATQHFSEFLSKIAQLRKIETSAISSGNLSMFFHSLGNYYLENLVKNKLHENFEEPFIDNLIINAAAVDQKDHDKWIEQLNFQKHIYINSNGKDMNLIGLRIFSSKKMQLGEDPEMPFASNASYVSFTEAVGASLPPGPSHSYFFASVTKESDRIKTYYTTILNGYLVDFEDQDMFYGNSEYLSYSIKF